jgi:hypothetical protein
MIKIGTLLMILFLVSCESSSSENDALLDSSDIETSEVINTDNQETEMDTQKEEDNLNLLEGDENIGDAKERASLTRKTEEIKSTTQKDEKEITNNIEEDTNVKENDTSSEKPMSVTQVKPISEKQEEKTPSNLHEAFDQFLSEFVATDGSVNYAGIKKSPGKLNTYLKTLESNPVQSSWSKNKKLAYWINAYNAFTIKRIIDNYPLKSIMDLDGGKTWDVKWIKLGDKVYSLNQIEHEIIRPQFKDARIHFAVNCAAKSCPPLYNKAYTEENVNRYLEKRTIQFINNASYNQISNKVVEISKIFEWYQEDFGELKDYLNKYLKDKEVSKKVTVTFKEYNWSLNKQ